MNQFELDELLLKLKKLTEKADIFEKRCRYLEKKFDDLNLAYENVKETLRQYER